MDWLPINIPLISNPINWVIIILTIMIGGFALHAIMPTISTDSL